MRRLVDAARRWLTDRASSLSARATVDVVVELRREAREDRVTGVAAELAFFGVLSLVPACIAIAAAMGSLESLIGDEAAQDVRDSVLSSLERVLTSEADGTIDAVRSLFEERSPGLLTFGLVGSLWAMSRGFAALLNALHVVYDLEEHRSYLRRRALSLLFSVATAVVAAVLVTMVVVGPLLGTGEDVADVVGLGDAFITFWAVLRWPTTMIVVVAWATALYHFAPNHRTPWRWDLPGAVVAAALWIVVTLGFRAYLAIAGSTNQVFGSLGGALILLVWLYLLGIGVLIGGEVNAILAARNRVPQPGQE